MGVKDYFRKNGLYLLIILFLCTSLYLTALSYHNRGILITVTGVIVLIMLAVLPAMFIYHMHRYDSIDEWKKEHEQMDDLIRKCVLEQKPQEQKSSNDILELMLLNLRDLREFYTISRKQAKNAFFLAACMCAAGTLLLLCSLAALFILPEEYGTLTVGAIGGTIVEVIAATSLLVYKRSLNQFNHYYRSLHENERFLSILNLTAKLSAEKQDDVYIRIIESQLSYINEENWMNMDRKEQRAESEPLAETTSSYTGIIEERKGDKE